MKWLLSLLRSPSSFRDDPWGYLRNQIGHAYIVGGGLTLIGVPLWLVMLGYAAWEATQLRFYGSTWDDSLEDMAHVTAIAMAAHFSQPALVIPQLLFVASGFMWRRGQ